MKAIVTGATGFIGLALCRELLQNGYDVTAVLRPDSPKKNKLLELRKEIGAANGSLQILEIPLDKIDMLHATYHIQADFFFHLAWNGPSGAAREDFDIQHSNIGYTARAVRTAKDCGCRKFTGAGSQAEYGVVRGTAYEDRTVPSPFMMYGTAKLAACQMGIVLARQLGISFVWPRIYSVYGVGENPGTLVNYVIDTLKKGEVPELSSCENMWNFLYITDCARALRMLMEDEDVQGICHVASKDTRLLKEYVTQIRDLIAPGTKLGFGIKQADPKRTFWLQPDVAKLDKTGFEAEVSFEEGIRRKSGE
ncbi:MAG: NAD(P)-dependent oxidoreductase [Ruminococcus flavefaciens]|nr:NAD(P)-dependent oxidoreductase [Ruminococcus flavefaciens]